MAIAHLTKFDSFCFILSSKKTQSFPDLERDFKFVFM